MNRSSGQSWMLLTFLVFAMQGCGGGSSDSPTITDDDNNDSEQTSDIAGHTWRLCNRFSATSSQYPQVFTDSEFVAIYNTFLNNDCTGTPHTSSELTSGTYTLGHTIVTSGGFNATEIDFHVTSAFGAPLSSAEQYTLYDIYYIDNDVLYYGMERSESAAGRSDTINFSDAYIQD